MDFRGWGPAAPPFGTAPDLHMNPADRPDTYDAAELQELQSRALRVLLGADSLLLPLQLRQIVLGSRSIDESSSRSKCLLELAVASLIEQGLVVRQGYGPFAALSVPDAALPKAEALAYSDFPDEGQLPLYGGAAAAAGLAGGGAQHMHPHQCPPARLNRLRRHSSPRQFGSRMAGVEKAGSVRRGKRSIAEDMGGLQLQKKVRLPNGMGSDSGAAPLSPGGMVAMSP